jgi:hypothetical protein
MDLVDLLTCCSLDSIKRDEIEQRFVNVPSKPEYEWVIDEMQTMSLSLNTQNTPIYWEIYGIYRSKHLLWVC